MHQLLDTKKTLDFFLVTTCKCFPKNKIITFCLIWNNNLAESGCIQLVLVLGSFASVSSNVLKSKICNSSQLLLGGDQDGDLSSNVLLMTSSLLKRLLPLTICIFIHINKLLCAER